MFDLIASSLPVDMAVKVFLLSKMAKQNLSLYTEEKSTQNS